MTHTALTTEELERRFGIAGRAQVLADAAGLPKVRLTAPQSIGEMHLHGAQVTSWRPAGAEEAIFLSRQARWEEGKAIRGGIPICFPWFRAYENMDARIHRAKCRRHHRQHVHAKRTGHSTMVACRLPAATSGNLRE